MKCDENSIWNMKIIYFHGVSYYTGTAFIVAQQPKTREDCRCDQHHIKQTCNQHIHAFVDSPRKGGRYIAKGHKILAWLKLTISYTVGFLFFVSNEVIWGDPYKHHIRVWHSFSKSPMARYQHIEVLHRNEAELWSLLYSHWLTLRDLMEHIEALWEQINYL